LQLILTDCPVQLLRHALVTLPDQGKR
jgi:hypothetical protein